MDYTRQQIIEKCEDAFIDKSTFYKKNFINYRGKTLDTDEYYTEVIAEFLCDNLNEYVNGIDCITRKSSYKTKGHDGVYDPRSNRKEEIIAMKLFAQSEREGPFDCIGRIIDYQTPLKSSVKDEAGKIDLLSFDGEIMRILELKKADSQETMLRCILESFTYLKTVDKGKLISDFGYEPEKVDLKANPFVFYGGEQHNEMLEDKPYLKMLVKLFDSKPYYIKELEKYVVVEE